MLAKISGISFSFADFLSKVAIFGFDFHVFGSRWNLLMFNFSGFLLDSVEVWIVLFMNIFGVFVVTQSGSHRGSPLMELNAITFSFSWFGFFFNMLILCCLG